MAQMTPALDDIAHLSETLLRANLFGFEQIDGQKSAQAVFEDDSRRPYVLVNLSYLQGEAEDHLGPDAIAAGLANGIAAMVRVHLGPGDQIVWRRRPEVRREYLRALGATRISLSCRFVGAPADAKLKAEEPQAA